MSRNIHDNIIQLLHLRLKNMRVNVLNVITNMWIPMGFLYTQNRYITWIRNSLQWTWIYMNFFETHMFSHLVTKFCQLYNDPSLRSVDIQTLIRPINCSNNYSTSSALNMIALYLKSLIWSPIPLVPSEYEFPQPYIGNSTDQNAIHNLTPWELWISEF